MKTRTPPGHRLAEPLEALDGDGLVVVAPGPELGADWEAVAHELGEVFDLSQRAMADGVPMVYVVHADDLLGRRGAAAAMVATGLLSAARTAALEGARAEIAVNVLAIDDDADAHAVGRWVARLADGDGVSGELVRLGAGHLGKALP